MTYRAPKGTYDVLPPASRRWSRLLSAWEDWSSRYGYELALTPIFETTEVFTRGVGESSEVVQKQMYTFTDRGGRSLTLRPEVTASVVRAYLEAGASGILKVSYAGPMFRYEQPQAGRQRQFLQLDVEYVGEPAPEADGEVVELGYRYLRAVGVEDLQVLLNSIGDRACRPQYLEVLRTWLRERQDELCEDCRRRVETNPLRVLDCKTCPAKLEDAPAPVDYLCDECRAHYQRVREVLGALEVPFQEAPHLVRGLDYYTRTAFEYLAPSLGIAQDALGGGGRYDGLAEALGGPPTAGVGVALGVERIALALAGSDEPAPLDLFVVVASDQRLDDALQLASRLRAEGLRIDLDLHGRSVKAQFRAADRRGAPATVVVGEEWQDGKVAARRMDTGEQELVPIEEVAGWARR
ncbi:MAG: histidine--tRNA ligase [Actinomycetota bacterium]|nr:histidine--tRNA ligase [Actinomycetota bacterium]